MGRRLQVKVRRRDAGGKGDGNRLNGIEEALKSNDEEYERDEKVLKCDLLRPSGEALKGYGTALRATRKR